MRTQRISKRCRAQVWMAPDFPIKLADLEPALDVIALQGGHAHVERLRGALLAHGIPKSEFPIQIIMPVILGVKAKVSFDHFELRDVEDAFFEVPPEYEVGPWKDD